MGIGASPLVEYAEYHKTRTMSPHWDAGVDRAMEVEAQRYYESTKGSSRARSNREVQSNTNGIDIGAAIAAEGAMLNQLFDKSVSFIKDTFKNYSITPDNIALANAQLNDLLKNPSNIYNNPLYQAESGFLKQATERALIAQGHNPAESGFGMASLQDSMAKWSLNTYLTAMQGIMKPIDTGTSLSAAALQQFSPLVNNFSQISPWGQIAAGAAMQKNPKLFGQWTT